jgi:hypothetical protein
VKRSASSARASSTPLDTGIAVDNKNREIQESKLETQRQSMKMEIEE